MLPQCLEFIKKINFSSDQSSTTEIIQINRNIINEVICYSGSTTNWFAQNGNPILHNGIKKIIIYKGATINKIDFKHADFLSFSLITEFRHEYKYLQLA
mmetsp:Transcript_8617/g.14569  ORF Transcript_8617/g.14569 Transcript_8617/m.14569 type:complete len:99 (-) Transcript_8617:42-338(-)